MIKLGKIAVLTTLLLPIRGFRFAPGTILHQRSSFSSGNHVMKRKVEEIATTTKLSKSLGDETAPQQEGKVVHGDLLELAREGDFDVIVHGCNCLCAMGAGIAKQIRDQCPGAYDADKATKKGDRDKLGTYSCAVVDGDHKSYTVVNAYTQYHWKGERKVLADYDAIQSVFAQIKADFAGQKIGYPKIGAGLAGGDWDRISSIINTELKGEDHTLVLYKKAT